jgi:hypothetical protein
MNLNRQGNQCGYPSGTSWGLGQAEAFCGGFNRPPHPGFGGGIHGRRGSVNHFYQCGRGYNGHPIPHQRVGGGPGISPALVVCYPYTIAGSWTCHLGKPYCPGSYPWIAVCKGVWSRCDGKQAWTMRCSKCAIGAGDGAGFTVGIRLPFCTCNRTALTSVVIYG